MNYGVFGTGAVGQAIGSKLISLGHEVCMGSRTKDNEKALAWKEKSGASASVGTFADAAAFGEVLFNCTSGQHSKSALALAGAALGSKVLVDISNPLDFSKGMPPSLTVCNTDSLAEQLQAAFPAVRVVKSLNTMTNTIMVNPGKLSAETDVFVAGNDAAAKATVTEILRSFGWKSVLDLGDITAARGLEMWLPLWVRLMGGLKTADFNLKIVR